MGCANIYIYDIYALCCILENLFLGTFGVLWELVLGTLLAFLGNLAWELPGNLLLGTFTNLAWEPRLGTRSWEPLERGFLGTFANLA